MIRCRARLTTREGGHGWGRSWWETHSRSFYERILFLVIIWWCDNIRDVSGPDVHWISACWIFYPLNAVNYSEIFPENSETFCLPWSKVMGIFGSEWQMRDGDQLESWCRANSDDISDTVTLAWLVGNETRKTGQEVPLCCLIFNTSNRRQILVRW